MTQRDDNPGDGSRVVDVILVAHNAGGLLRASVASAVEQAGCDAVWVVDAETTDGSVEAMAAEQPGVHVLQVSNAGFSAGNNRGIEQTAAPYVLLLNPDAELQPDALAILVGVAEAHPNAAIVGPAILNTDGSPQAGAFGRFPTLANTVGLRFSRLANRMRGNRTQSPQLPEKTQAVDWVTGAAMLVRRSAVQDAGKMDEAFFLYYEDVEWCHRMRDRGWDVLLEPSSHVVHHLGAADVPADRVERAYRESFYRYCDLYGLWGLKALARVALSARVALGGRG
jgi:GT2 family glycosyltransferase